MASIRRGAFASCGRAAASRRSAAETSNRVITTAIAAPSIRRGLRITPARAAPTHSRVNGPSGWYKRSRTVVLGNQDLQPFAIDRAAKSRALTTLERAGLIDIVGRPGRLPTITLLDTTGLEVAAAKGGRTASQRGG